MYSLVGRVLDVSMLDFFCTTALFTPESVDVASDEQFVLVLIGAAGLLFFDRINE